MGSFCPEKKMHELKIFIGVMCNDTDNDKKYEEEWTCRFKIDIRNLTNFDSITQNFQTFTL